MDVRIGVTNTAREIELELDDSTERDELRGRVAEALAGDIPVLWITDRRGREVGVAAEKIAYVEVGAPESSRSIGFSA